MSWYHTLELPEGPTPGEFDIRGLPEVVPWPEITGARCLDVATFDGFWAFELERRGAAEVVALDIPSFADVDWLPRSRARATDEPTGAGFRLAAAAKKSRVERIEGNIYDLHADVHGTFDVVVLGALLLHLRSPFAALEAVRGVTTGSLISIEQVDVKSSLLHRRRPFLRIRGARDWIWAVPNAAGHLAMLNLAGFDVHETRRAVMPFGQGASPDAVASASRLRQRVGRRLYGIPTVAGVAASIAVATPAPGVLPPTRTRSSSSTS